MLATNLSEAESTETKLRMAFKIYDKDSSGDLTDDDKDCIVLKINLENKLRMRQ